MSSKTGQEQAFFSSLTVMNCSWILSGEQVKNISSSTVLEIFIKNILGTNCS